MKKFFKKIAFVSAMAMVVSNMPAQSAAAAEGPQMYKSLKFYLGGDVTETYSDEARYAKVWNKDGYTVEFDIDNEDVATVSKKGKVTPVGVGTATVTATFTDEDGEEVEKTCVVTVKKNAVEAGVTEKSAERLQNLTVGEEFQLVAYRTDADGITVKSGRDVITDGVRFAVDKEGVIEVGKSKGYVKAVGAGEATLTVWAVQSEKPVKDENGKVTEYKATTDKKEYAVKVAGTEPVVTGVTVKSTTKIELAVANVTAENVGTLKVYNDVSGDITSLFKDAVLSEDKKTVTIEKYIALKNDEKLTFTFGDGEAYEYTVKIGEASAVVVTKPVVAVNGQLTNIEFSVVDANGIDLGVTADKVNVSLNDATYAYTTLDTTKNIWQLTMYQEGKTVDVTVTYNTGKYDANWAVIELKDTITVTCVKESDAIVDEAKYLVAKPDKFDATKYATSATMFEDKDGSKDTQTYKLFTQLTLSNGNKVENTGTAASCFTYEALTPSVLLVDAKTGYVVAVAPGTAKVLINYYNGFENVTVVATVVVKADATLSSITVDGNGKVLSNAVDVNEKVTFTLHGSDQYGEYYWQVPKSVESLTAPTNVSAAVANSLVNIPAWTNNVVFTAAGAVAGTYTYKVSMDNDKTAIISVTVKAPDLSNAPASYKIIPATTNLEIDPKKVESETNPISGISFSVVAVDKYGIAMNIVSSGFDAGSWKVVRDGWASVSVTDNANGTYVINYAATGGADIVTAIDGYSITTGSYAITGKVNGRTVVPATVAVSIKKTAPAYNITSASVEVGVNGDYKTVIANKFVIANGDIKYDIVGLGDIVTTIDVSKKGTSYVLVKTIKVYETLEGGNQVLHTVNVNRYFTVTAK